MPLVFPPLDMAAIHRAAGRLREGQVVAFPTETFYALGALALDAEAVDRLNAIKNRPADKALPCLVGEWDQLPSLCEDWPPAAQALAVRFWPGPLTLVVPARTTLPLPLRPEGFVGVRLSSHPWARALALAAGGPLTSTSANLSGQPEATGCEELDPVLAGRLGGILDGGTTPGGSASTIVRVEGDRLTCLRDGALPFAELTLARR